MAERSETRSDLGHSRAYRGGEPVFRAHFQFDDWLAFSPIQLTAQCSFELQPVALLDLGRFIQRRKQRARQPVWHGSHPLVPSGSHPGGHRPEEKRRRNLPQGAYRSDAIQ